MPPLPSTLPVPRTPPPREAPSLRWGIIAPGGIANDFVAALQHQTGQRVVAAGSRSLERAQAFCDRHHLDRAYGSYEELASDPEVDVVYVATVNSGHRDFVFATRNRALQLRYLVRLYVKELVLKNFAGLPADQLLERMIELSLYAEEKLKSS